MYLFAVSAALFFSAAAVHAEEDVSPQTGDYLQVIGLIHLDSSVSGGENTPEMIAAVARNAGAEVGIFTDHDTQRVTYGIWPLRNILKISHSRSSIRTYGISRYLREIAEINGRMKNFVLIPGIEAVPYYRWTRERGGVVSLADLHRHILVMGLDSADEIAHLPSIETGYPLVYTRESLAGLIWLVPFLIALFVVTLPPGGEPFHSRVEAFLNSRFSRMFAYVVLGTSIVFLVNAYPFREFTVSQYGLDRKEEPYQQVIDYVNIRKGLTFWAHPEATFNERIGSETGISVIDGLLKLCTGGGLQVKTEPYSPLLNDTENYTGFSLFNEGYKIVGKPEGLWDFLLMQFCAGRRQRPAWAIAELDLESGTAPEDASESQTVFLVREKNERAYLEALRNGRMYCFTHFMTRRLAIRGYSVVSGMVRAVSGEVVPYQRDARLIFDLESHGEPINLEVVVVADGEVIARKQTKGSDLIEVTLPEPEQRLGYVRVVVMNGSEPVAATNPIFVRREGRP